MTLPYLLNFDRFLLKKPLFLIILSLEHLILFNELFLFVYQLLIEPFSLTLLLLILIELIFILFFHILYLFDDFLFIIFESSFFFLFNLSKCLLELINFLVFQVQSCQIERQNIRDLRNNRNQLVDLEVSDKSLVVRIHEMNEVVFKRRLDLVLVICRNGEFLNYFVNFWEVDLGRDTGVLLEFVLDVVELVERLERKLVVLLVDLRKKVRHKIEFLLQFLILIFPLRSVFNFCPDPLKVC